MNMEKGKFLVALFDFDGVVMDTETQYTVFWDAVGKRYFPEVSDFGHLIKGQTLVQIYQKHFAGMETEQQEITEALNRFEREMSFEYVPGVVEFIADLRANGVKTAIVTSSNQLKMECASAAHPELSDLTDRILTAEMFTRSKPAPDCFLLGAEIFGVKPENCVVFEDSFHGLEAGKAAGMTVVGLSTTNSSEQIKPYCSWVIPHFKDISYEIMMRRI